jgi:hypothetical protein
MHLNIAASLWKRSHRYRMVLLFSALALGIFMTPLQKSISLGRYQHYGMAIACFGMGYLSQFVWSFRTFSSHARAAYLATGLFFTSVGLTFYANPWLDYRMAVQTPEKEQLRQILVATYLFLATALASIWIRWIKEETRAKASPVPKQPAPTTKE